MYACVLQSATMFCVGRVGCVVGRVVGGLVGVLVTGALSSVGVQQSG